jgi:para-nitrobenzyl esterase
MVWVHGGGFATGTGASGLYEGSRLAAVGDVVVVTCNYRLGALGFLGHPALADGNSGCGNWGLLDQLAVLRWVRDSVGDFGGDPGNVTVFGESAGAMSIAALLSATEASGLFARAVLQSGPPASSTVAWAQRRAERLAAIVGVDLDGRSIASALRSVPAGALVRATRQLFSEATADDGLRLPFIPVVDGGLLLDSPEAAIAAGTAANVPLLVGTNRDECTFFTLGDREVAALDELALNHRVARFVGDERAPALVNAYRSARAARGEPVTAATLWTAILTDRVFRMPSLALASDHARHQLATFVYLFEWASPFLDGALGACHALEIPFIFGTVRNPTVSLFTGSGSTPIELSDHMQQAWLAFARTGDPSCDALGEWPNYDSVAHPTMVFGQHVSVVDDPRPQERAIWGELGALPPGGHLHR